MKKLTKILTITAVFLFIATSAFSFQWISFQNDKTDMMIQGTLGYGSFVVIPIEIMPAGVIFETKIPGVDRLSAGAGLGNLSVDLDLDGEANDVSDNYITLSAYAKYIFLSADQINDLIHFPVYIGAAAGIGYQIALSNNISLSDTSFGGLKALAVGFVGYNMGWATATIYPGIIDNKFTVSGDFNFNLGDRMHLGLFWVPLIGLGASFTYAL